MESTTYGLSIVAPCHTGMPLAQCGRLRFRVIVKVRVEVTGLLTVTGTVTGTVRVRIDSG